MCGRRLKLHGVMLQLLRLREASAKQGRYRFPVAGNNRIFLIIMLIGLYMVIFLKKNYLWR
jgi:hypothetical protein